MKDALSGIASLWISINGVTYGAAIECVSTLVIAFDSITEIFDV